MKKWGIGLIVGLGILGSVLVTNDSPSLNDRDVLYIATPGASGRIGGQVIAIDEHREDWTDANKGLVENADGSRTRVVTLGLTDEQINSLTTNARLFKVDDVDSPDDVVSLNDFDMVGITQSSVKMDDVVIIVRAPVYVNDRYLFPNISKDIRKLRRNDSIIYDSDKDGSKATTCRLIMIVPRENRDEIIKRVSDDKTLEIVSVEDELSEAGTFPMLSEMKAKANLSVSNGD